MKQKTRIVPEKEQLSAFDKLRPMCETVSPEGEMEMSMLWQSLRLRRASPDAILQMFGIKHPPVDVRAIAQAIGVAVLSVPSPGWSGAVDINEERAVIWIDAAEKSEARQRFTIAHELGHLMLHQFQRAYRDMTFDGSKEEIEANRFAAKLLMPAWMLDSYATPGNFDNVDKLARRFAVSRPAMFRRLAGGDIDGQSFLGPKADYPSSTIATAVQGES